MPDEKRIEKRSSDFSAKSACQFNLSRGGKEEDFSNP